MVRSKGLSVLAALAAGAVLCLAGEAFAQPDGGDAGGGRGGRGGATGGRMGGRGTFDANVMRAQAAARMKEALGCTDEELAVLQPKIEKVQQLQRESRGGGFGGMMGGRGGRGGRGGDTTGAPAQSEVQKKMAALQTLLQNKESSAEDVRDALRALREARAEAKKALEEAQKALKEVLTVKQEAYFVTTGLLE